MVSLKLKYENRSNLYFNKCKYKVAITNEHFGTIGSTTTLSGFMTNRHYGRSPSPWTLTEDEKVFFERFFEFKTKFAADPDNKSRHEWRTITFYSNDIDVLNEIEQFNPNAVLYEIKLMPTGIKTFAREPEHKYRVYMKSKQLQDETKATILDYVAKTSNIYLSDSFVRWTNRTFLYPYMQWLDKSYFIDYDDPTMLTMMHLMFSEALGKSFKLEKRT